MNFKVFRTCLHDEAGGMVRIVGGSVSETDTQLLRNEGKIVGLGKVLVDEGYGCTRIYHCVYREGRAVKIKSDGDRNGVRIII